MDLEDLQEIESISLSTKRQLEPVNNSTSTPASKVETSVVLLASDGGAAVSNSKVVPSLKGVASPIRMEAFLKTGIFPFDRIDMTAVAIR
ncbi:hypothetical protein TNIN_70711 [Trichonephila inaurata madagascariensis]|uniref:Uncharacterized protein n=1 Tax=Trichonephila inaurata madagascariensis TaxID=2747483 RepID=A0A8X6J7F2_9ARAC|nr:hypothetical protein TNIN_70711 [Trichonephila inaurata madagascariensis]